jgi:chromosome segregation ATPase
MDQDLKDYLDQMGRRLSDEILQIRVLVDERGSEIQQLRGSIEKRGEEIQQLQISMDKRGEEIQQLQISMDKRGEEIRQTGVLLERQHDDIRQVAEGVMGTNESLDSFRVEVSQQLDQVRSLISPPYTDLNRRVKLLESWKKRKDRDPVELVRERFGKPKD